MYHTHCPSVIVRKSTPATASVLSLEASEMTLTRPDTPGTTSILQYQNTTFRRVHWAFKDRSFISLLGESGPHLCVSVRSQVSDLVTVEPPSWFSSSVNVNVWLRSLITLHLNQRSQLECDSRSESRSLPILRNSKIPAAIFVCLFLREHWCWFTIMKMSLWPVQSSVGGREGGWEGFPFVRLSSLNHCGDI